MTLKRCAPLWATLWLVAGLWQVPIGAFAAPASPSEELLRASQMWWGKGRADLARQMLEKLLVIEPDSAPGLAAMGELWVREGKVDKAVEILQTLRARVPRHPSTLELAELVRVNTTDAEKLAHMRLLARAGRRSEAADLARDLFPQGNPPTLGGLALEYFQVVGAAEKNPADVARQLDRLHAQTGDVSYRVAQIEVELGRGGRGQSVLPAIESLSGLREVNANVLRQLWQRALEQAEGSLTDRIFRLQRYLARFPDDPVMVERLAALQQNQERAQRAARDPAYLARTAALAALEQGQLPLAEAELQKVLALKPKDSESLGNLGLVRLRQGQHEPAQALFEQAFRQTGLRKWKDLQATARFWGLLRQTDMAVDARDLDTAAELAQKAVSLQPDSPEALVALADVRKLQSGFVASENLYLQALRQRADHTPALKGLADVLAKQGKTAEALEWLEKSVRTDPKLAADLAGTRAEMLSDQAEAHLLAKRPSEALRALESAVMLRPDDPWIRHRLAKIYIQLGLPRFATAVMDEGTQRQGNDPSMRHARALIRSAVDDDRGALEDLSHIPASARSDGMNAMVRRAVVGQMVSEARPPDVGGRGAELLEVAERRAGDDLDLLQSVAYAWNRLGKPERGLAVVERVMATRSPVSRELGLVHAQWLNRARRDDRLALVLPELMQRSDWSDPQLTDLLAIYGEHQERLIERSQAGGDGAGAKRLAQVALPEVSDQVLKEKTKARLLMAAAEYGDAALALGKVLQAQPGDSDARFDLGTALVRLGQLPEAREQALWLKANLPAGDGGAQLALLRLWQRLGDVAQARALSEQLVQRVRPRARPLPDGESEPVATAAERSRQIEFDSDVLAHAARLERSEGRYTKAMALFSDAVKLEQMGAVLSAAGSAAQGGDRGADAPLALRLTRDAPRPLAGVLTTEAARVDGGADRIRREMDAIEARRQSWVEVGQKALNKPSTSGISTVNGWERAAVAWFPRGYDGKYFVHIDQVQLNAGALSSNRQDVLDYGQVAAWPEGAYPTSGAVQRATATHAGVGFVADRQSWDLGVTGLGFPVTNWVGGYEQSGNWNNRYGYRWGLSRRPLTGSLLSYAGARDPITGQVWGGVVATGGSLRFSGDVGPVGMSVSARHDVLTGRNVLSNRRTQLRWLADRDVWQTPQQVLNMGFSVGLTRHARDLSEYSWGQGGYYSPQRLLSLSVPTEWSGRDGAWAWLVRGALSWSASSSAATAYYPAHPVLQNQAGNRFYTASRGTGLGIAARAAVEHQATRNWVWGAQLELERSDAYSPTHFLLYARYLLDPVRVPLENRPRPVQFYSEF